MAEEIRGERGSGWKKAIPQRRDRFQSRWLVRIVGTLLVAIEALWFLRSGRWGLHHLAASLVISAAFGAVVFWLRAATAKGASFGALICLIFLSTTHSRLIGLPTALPPLVWLFLVTFAATKMGRLKKERMGVAEPRRGRRSSQVVANLGAAGLAAGCFVVNPGVAVACLAALAEATADTVSSELGQVFGGGTVMMTTFEAVAPGTDGAISWVGTLAGVLAGGSVVLVGMWSLQLEPFKAVIAFVASVYGLFFDSLLGGTLERRGWIGNDLVNFSSTMFAAGLAAAMYVGLVLL
jgi:uncharacterized protein (TIGR00297 family)